MTTTAMPGELQHGQILAALLVVRKDDHDTTDPDGSTSMETAGYPRPLVSKRSSTGICATMAAVLVSRGMEQKDPAPVYL